MGPLSAFLQDSGADLADFDGHTVTTDGQFPSPPHTSMSRT